MTVITTLIPPPLRTPRPQQAGPAPKQPAPQLCRIALSQAIFDGAWMETRMEHIIDRVGGLS